MKKIYVVTIVWVVALCLVARAEMWPTLENYVKACRLIVLCNTELVDGTREDQK